MWSLVFSAYLPVQFLGIWGDCYTERSKSLCAPDDYSTINTQKRWPSQNTFGMWTVLYWTQSSRTQFGVSINVWRLAGDTLNITLTFCIVLIRCTETFWSLCISGLRKLDKPVTLFCSVVMFAEEGERNFCTNRDQNFWRGISKASIVSYLV
jgi:hypothetical protein